MDRTPHRQSRTRHAEAQSRELGSCLALIVCIILFASFVCVRTQHVGEYSTVIVVGAGIGATPVSSTLKSIVFYKWRVNVGECFPAHAYFMWVCAYRDIDAFRWLLRTIKEAQDEIGQCLCDRCALRPSSFIILFSPLLCCCCCPCPLQCICVRRLRR